MFVTPRFHPLKGAILILSALAAIAVVPAARAQDTYDAQIPFSFSSPTLTSPNGIAVAPDGTVYIADPETGVVRITPTSGLVGGPSGGAALIASTAATLAPSIALTAPTAVAVDSTGALYIADATAGKVIELLYPETSSAATAITYAETETPTALAVDSSNNLYIADETKNAIYKVVGGVATKLAISPDNLMPVGLAVDSAGDVYFASAKKNKVYEYTASTAATAADTVAGTFEFSATNAKFPIGMGFDPAGNLYVMDSGSGSLTEVTSATSYQLPLSSAVTPASMAVSSIGNLYISDDAGETADEVFYNNNPFNFGSIPAGTNSPAVTVNFLFTTHAHGLATYESMQGDITTEFKTSSSTCSGEKNSTCSMAFYVDYSSTLPGTRNGVVGLTDNAGDILAVPSTGIDLASALALYPGTQVALSQTSRVLYEPQGLAVTGDGGTLFVADEGEYTSGATPDYSKGAVWSYKITAGTPGATATQVGTFPTPDAVALDAAGNLYVADYSGTVTVMPVTHSKANGNTWPGSFEAGTPLTLTGAVALNHPMALTFDPSGNLYIGDMGPGGVDATASNPGYIIKVPANGGPAVRLNYQVGGIAIAFPQALATDSQGNLYIADGGDGATDPGGVDVVPVATGTASAISFGDFAPLDQPAGLSFDAANDLYVLDGYNQRVLVVPMTYNGTVPAPNTGEISLLGQGDSGITSTLITPSNLVVWQGGQYITISDIGFEPQSGTGSPVQILTLQSLNATVNASAGAVSLTGVDVGNEEINFQTPGNTNPAAFSLSSCGISGPALAIGASTVCAPTVTFTGTTAQSATITLNGDLSSDYSALGNKIFASGVPNEPIATLSAPTTSFSQTVTATLTNSGDELLTINSIAVTGDATITGGTCGASLAANSSCTIVIRFKNKRNGRDRYNATIEVTDNSGNVASEQTAKIVYRRGFGF